MTHSQRLFSGAHFRRRTLLGFAIFAALLPLARQLPAAERKFTPAELRADFTAMYNGLQSAAFDLFAFTPKAALDRAFREFLAEFDKPLTLFQAQVRFEEFAALVRMGHARVDFPFAVWKQHLENGGKAFPVNIRVMDGKTVVAQNHSGIEAIARGDEIIQMNGSKMAQWLKRTTRHVSAETPYMAHSLMEYDFPMYLWVESGEPRAFNLLLRNAECKTRKVRLPGRTGAEMKAFAAAQPPALSLEKPMREAKILADNVGYLRPGPFYNAEAKTGAEQWDVSSFRNFIDDAFTKFNVAQVERLIIDLRGNPGGDNLFSDVMVAWFAEKPFRFYSDFKVRVSPESIQANADRLQNDAAAAGPVSRQYAELYARAKPGEIVEFDMPLVQPRQDTRFQGSLPADRSAFLFQHSRSRSAGPGLQVRNDYRRRNLGHGNDLRGNGAFQTAQHWYRRRFPKGAHHSPKRRSTLPRRYTRHRDPDTRG
jgi:hypothetical protein